VKNVRPVRAHGAPPTRERHPGRDRTPIPECAKVEGLVSFFNEKVDEIRVDGKVVLKPVTRWS
jgi:hypothetical protein